VKIICTLAQQGFVIFGFYAFDGSLRWIYKSIPVQIFPDKEYILRYFPRSSMEKTVVFVLLQLCKKVKIIVFMLPQPCKKVRMIVFTFLLGCKDTNTCVPSFFSATLSPVMEESRKNKADPCIFAEAGFREIMNKLLFTC
jgi:hypothetical protein